MKSYLQYRVDNVSGPFDLRGVLTSLAEGMFDRADVPVRIEAQSISGRWFQVASGHYAQSWDHPSFVAFATDMFDGRSGKYIRAEVERKVSPEPYLALYFLSENLAVSTRRFRERVEATTLERHPEAGVTVLQRYVVESCANLIRGRKFVAIDEFAIVRHGNETYHLTTRQAQVVEYMFQRLLDGFPHISQATIFEEVLQTSSSNRLRDIFRSSRAWGKLVKPGIQKGTFYLDV